MSTAFILPETADLLQFLASQEAPHLAELSAGEMREAYGAMGEYFDTADETGIATRDIDASVPMRLYLPDAAAGDTPVIVYFHGGGWEIGDLDSHHNFCAAIAAGTGLRLAAVDYRLAPEHVFPAAHDDCLTAANRVLAGEIFEDGIAGIALAGDSAGANLALATAAALGAKNVLAQWLIYPVGDCFASATGSYRDFAEGFLLDRRLMDRFIADYLPDEESRKDPRVSPLLSDPLPRYPASTIVTAGLDPLRDEGRAIAGRVVASGADLHYIEAHGLLHGMATMRKVQPSAVPLLARAAHLFRDQIISAHQIRQEQLP